MDRGNEFLGEMRRSEYEEAKHWLDLVDVAAGAFVGGYMAHINENPAQSRRAVFAGVQRAGVALAELGEEWGHNEQ